MPRSERTNEVAFIFNQHVIDKELSEHDAYSLSLKEPKDLKKIVKGLEKFDALELKNSLRAVRNSAREACQKKWQAANAPQGGQAKSSGSLFGGAPRPEGGTNVLGSTLDANPFTPTKKRKGSAAYGASDIPFPLSGSTQYVYGSASSSGFTDGCGMEPLESMSSLSISDSYDNFTFKTYQEIIDQPETSLAVMLSKNPRYFKEQLKKALGNDRKGAHFFTKECAGAENLLASIERAADIEDEAHDHFIAANEKKILDIQAQLDDAVNNGKFLRRRKLMSTGKARAFLHIVRKCLTNIEAATLTDDQDDFVAMEEHHKTWTDDVVELQSLMNDGQEEAIEVILGKMKREDEQKMAM